ncbi:hypothetical protein ACFWXH_25115 [Mesorhizobium sp. NPDC059054]|nr:hypothetical protein [Mesorhizobium sp. 1M-11]
MTPLRIAHATSGKAKVSNKAYSPTDLSFFGGMLLAFAPVNG